MSSKRHKSDPAIASSSTSNGNNSISTSKGDDVSSDKIDRFTHAITREPGAIRDLIANLILIQKQQRSNSNDNNITDWEAIIYNIDERHAKFFKRISVPKLPSVILHNILGFIELRHHLTVFEHVCRDFQQAARSYTQAWSSLVYKDKRTYKDSCLYKLIRSVPMSTWLPGIGQQRMSMITRIKDIVNSDDLHNLNAANFGQTLKHLSLRWESDIDAVDMTHFTQLQALESFSLHCHEFIMPGDNTQKYYALPLVTTLKSLCIELHRDSDTITPIFVSWSGWINLNKLDLTGFIVPINLPEHLPDLRELVVYMHSSAKIARDINDRNLAYRQIAQTLNLSFVQSAHNLTSLALDSYLQPRLVNEISRTLSHTLTTLLLYGDVDIVLTARGGTTTTNESQQLTDFMKSVSRLTNLQMITLPHNCITIAPYIYELNALTTLILVDWMEQFVSLDIKRLPRLASIDITLLDDNVVPFDMRRVWKRFEFTTLFERLTAITPPLRRIVVMPIV